MTPPSAPRAVGTTVKRRGPVSFLALAVVMAGLATSARRAMDGTGAAAQTPGEAEPRVSCQETGMCAKDGVVEAAIGAPVVTLEEAAACRDSAYLCSGLEWKSGTARAFRWNEATRVIRVLVPLPAGGQARAREIQQAAMRGVRAWDRHPFLILVEDRDRGAPADITVEWMSAPPGNQLGLTSTRWTQEGGRATLEVTSFRLALASPSSGGPLATRQIELTAAHEMGHALGLPHSDQQRDVMYPTNTVLTLSARDYKAMEALYRLPNGVGIWRGG